MGNEYGQRKGRPRAEVLRRFWQTSIFITYSTCGSKRGVKSGHTVMSSSCASRMTSWWDSTARRMPISSERNLRNECESSTWNCIPRRRDFWSLVRMRSTNGSGVEKGNNGRFTVLRQTIRKRLQTKLNEVKAELQRRMHEPIPDQGKWLQAVVRGHIRYYGVPMNNSALARFRFQVGRLWHRALSRRSQNGRVLWDRMRRLIKRWLPVPIVGHPYPLRRMGVVT